MTETHRPRRNPQNRRTLLAGRWLGEAASVAEKPNRRTRTPKPSGRRQYHNAAAAVPPVLIRSERAVLPVRERKRPQTRRQMHVALNVPGAEVRLPAMPSIHLNWRWASGILTALLAALLLHLWTSPNYKVSDVEIIGLQRMSSMDVSTVIGLSGASIFSVDAQQITKDLQEAFPGLKNITVQVGLPARISVLVEERQPVLAWAHDGQSLWIDAEGLAFPAKGEGGPALAVDSKEIPPDTLPGKVRNTYQFDPKWIGVFEKFAGQIPEGAGLVYSAERGLGWNDPAGWQVFFGSDLSNLDTKFLVYQALLKNLQDQGITPALISVEYVHAPYYRTER
jgi:cell division protein FtsQ